MGEEISKHRLRDDVLAIRQLLHDGRAKLLKQHQEGSPGIQVCAHLTELLDKIVLQIFDAALRDLGPLADELRDQVALVAYGGYGRCEMAPYSDVDLMVLHEPSVQTKVSPLAQRLVKDFSDVGIDLGHSVRTVRQAIQLSAHDAVVFTSLVDSRLLIGSPTLFQHFQTAFARMTRRRSHALITMVETARREERTKYGETVYLLEPNVKRSRGGLRDLQMVRWIGFARYGQRDPKYLESNGLISSDDYRALRKAQEFLLRLRNELHFQANSSADMLGRVDQVRIAELWGYAGSDGVRPVEEFMRAYFSHSSSVRHVLSHFLDGARWRYPRVRRLLSAITDHRVDGDFRAGPTYISATRRGRVKLRHHLATVLQLMDLSSRYNCRIDHPTWTTIRDAMMNHQDWKVDEDAANRFLSFLSQPNQLGRQLRRLHELRVLSILVPGFEHVRCLLQFNDYHKYTVDEHSIRAVERVTEFAQQTDSVLGQTYREIKNKALLHLALLVHDLGKGFPEDHSEVGARIALDVAQALFLNERDTETLRFLVHRHLMLSHLAFRRDTSDEALIVEHCAEIGSPAILQLLYVLSCADLAAVGPGVLNQWKQDVLTQLYVRMMDQLTGGVTSTAPASLAAKRLRLLQDPVALSDPEWFQQQVASLPPAYLDGPSQDTILADLARLHDLDRNQSMAWARYIPERNAVEYSVGVYEDAFSGIFHRLTGALTGQGLEILAAEIHSLADHLCLDRFYVQDNDYRGEPPPERFATVIRALTNSLQSDYQRPPFRRTWQQQSQSSWQRLTDLPTKIKIDNSTSDQFTIIDVFAHDRPGLLYAITRTLFELRLSVATAKIGTYLDQVVDVFYVTDTRGLKIAEESRIQEVRQALLEAIKAFEQMPTC